MASRLLILLLTLINAGSSLANDDKFPIGVGDSLRIDVYDEADLAVRSKVPQSGVIRMPLVGDVKVLGLTPKKLAEALEAMLFDGYLVNPSVSVEIQSYRPIYVKGAVREPGSFGFVVGVTVEQAIAMAGGLKDRASENMKNWKIQRGTQEDAIQVQKDTQLMPGDILTIQESLF